MSNNKNIAIFVIIPTIIFSASALPTDTKSEKSEKIGPCVNGLCPVEYECISNDCIKTQTFKNFTKGQSVGPCINGLCPGHHTCYDDFCYNKDGLVDTS
ncbi:unnamed protein product [Cercopithifilaria johnstoni]|uniref:CC domain-containing protein n=1 Tax=Cercopithifilaria johnstoni TaxID=2874296 RepID=A0A8J2LXP6_9BILA|nr:unnamed protein product [Cercopithifilaria johnstoni]